MMAQSDGGIETHTTTPLGSTCSSQTNESSIEVILDDDFSTAGPAASSSLIKLWRMLRERDPEPLSPTPLDELIAEVLAGQTVVNAEAIDSRLSTAASNGGEPPQWQSILNDPRQRRLLRDLLHGLSLVEHTTLGTATARRLRDLPDSTDVQAVLAKTSHQRRPSPQSDGPRLNDDELRLLAQIASGVTADVAARKLNLSARALRRQLRTICDRLDVSTPIEAVVWAARRQLL